MTTREVRSLQRRLNVFVKHYLDGVAPIRVDGKLGHSTAARIRLVKFYLGYMVPVGAGRLDATADHDFRSRLWHPKSVRYTTPARLARAAARRIEQRRRWRKHQQEAARADGVGTFDGRPCANWLIPYLQWARGQGWRGTLTSGWRDPNYSRGLCIRMCGAPSCPGRCAGLGSNHVGSARPRGAMDVTDYVRFGELMRRCPFNPRLFNALGARDPVHYSASGN